MELVFNQDTEDIRKGCQQALIDFPIWLAPFVERVKSNLEISEPLDPSP